jgi:hypothetical protein
MSSRNAARAAAPSAAPADAPQFVSALFHVEGPADAGLLPRLIEAVAKLGLVPSRVHASCEAGDGSEMSVELKLAAVPARAAEQVESGMRRLVGVSRLLVAVEPVRMPVPSRH